MAEEALNTFDLDLVQGETYERTFRWLIAGEEQDLSEWTVKSQIRKKESVNSPLVLELAQYVSLESSGGDVENDQLRLRIPANVTSELSFTRDAAWDLFLILTDDPTTGFALLQGVVTLDPATTDTVEDV